jgi:hypothetical protein
MGKSFGQCKGLLSDVLQSGLSPVTNKQKSDRNSEHSRPEGSLESVAESNTPPPRMRE